MLQKRKEGERKEETERAEGEAWEEGEDLAAHGHVCFHFLCTCTSGEREVHGNGELGSRSCGAGARTVFQDAGLRIRCSYLRIVSRKHYLELVKFLEKRIPPITLNRTSEPVSSWGSLLPSGNDAVGSDTGVQNVSLGVSLFL